MQELLSQVEWMPVIVSFVLSFGLGWLWYSPVMFLKKWQAGIGVPIWASPMWMPLLAQAGSTLLFAIFIHLSISSGYLVQAILVSLIIAGFIKANGFYSGKTMFAVSVEVGFIVVMAIVMILTNYLLL